MNALSWSYITPKNVIDFLLVTFLVYRILLLIKGTRAAAMLTGLFIISVCYVVASQVQLKTLSWVLYQFLSSIIIILIVIFQDDIRRGLTKVGLGSIFKRQKEFSMDKTIDDLTLVATRLARDKVGALIVIQRKVGLEDFIEDAVPLDSLVNRKLILAIFDKNCALHDGALIIEGDRIKAAGCVLPLSYNPDLDPNLGTRHRASLGISEKSDAVVIVVSEETGGISVCRDGKLNRNLDSVMLRECLQHFLLNQNNKAGEK